MSDAAPEYIELPPSGDAAFAALMDALVPDTDGAQGGQADTSAGAAAPADGQPAAGSQGAPAADAAAGAPAAGDGGKPAVPGDGAAPAGGVAAPAGSDTDAAGTGAGTDAAAQSGSEAAPAAGTDAAAQPGADERPAEWTADATDYVGRLGQLSNKLEEQTVQRFQDAALVDVRTEHSKYFEALELHPRALVGREVPSATGEGMETLRDSADAAEWQAAIKQMLVAEVRSRATRAMESEAGNLSTVHASIKMFQDNPDLIPGTKDFDVQLANAFSEFAEPYQVRVDGKLQGYSIPVQPIINQLRARLVADRAKAAATSSSAAATPAAGGTPAPPAAGAPVEPPQAGIPSKPGAGEAEDDFSVLFGTLGLPNLRI